MNMNVEAQADGWFASVGIGKKVKTCQKQKYHIWDSVCVSVHLSQSGKNSAIRQIHENTTRTYASHTKKFFETNFRLCCDGGKKEFLIGWYVIYFLRIKSLARK